MNAPQEPTGFSTMSSVMPEAMNYHRWILDLIKPRIGGQVLEVGFGYGQYTVELARHADCVVAVNRDAGCLEVRDEMPDNVDLLVADASADDFPRLVGVSHFDHAVCVNVLEHIEDDVGALRNVREVLRPGGSLLLFVPAMSALYGPMDSMAGHVRRYGRRLLHDRLGEAGFEVSELRYFNPLGAVGWWANAKLMHPKDLSAPSVNRQILWYDRFVQPFSRALDPLTKRFLGQSLWAVGSRPVPSR